MKLVKRPSYKQKLKSGGQIQKYQLGRTMLNIASQFLDTQEDNFSTRTLKSTINSLMGQPKYKSLNLAQKAVKGASKLDIYHKFKSKDYDEFVRVMYPIFMVSLKKYNLPTTQIQNILRQSAYESSYGTEPRGAQGYNLGGVTWEDNPNSNTYNYKHTTFAKDGKEYVDFDNLQDYADFKVQLLNDTYHALDAPNTDDYVNRLHGQNSSKKSYSINPEGYRYTLNHMISFDKAYNNYINR